MLKIKASTIILPLSFLIFFGCKNPSSENSNPESGMGASPATTSTAPSSSSDKPIESAPASNSISQSSNSAENNCDKFLLEYEIFSMNYIGVIQKYYTDPSNTAYLSEMSRYGQESQQLVERWKDLSKDCANDPTYVQKFQEMYNRVIKASTEFIPQN